MNKVYILCHSISEKFIRANLNAMVSEIGRLNGIPPVVRILDRVDDFVCLDNSVVFVIGDPFKPFPRNEKCFYVFVNFSIVSFIGRFKYVGLSARRWILDKKRAFKTKLKQYDLIVDFYEPQTVLLKEKYKRQIEIMNFLPNISCEVMSEAQLSEGKKYDLCVVGALTPRRKKLYDKLKKMGAVLSPYVTDDLDEIIKASRFVLNVHAFDCNTAELPRIVHALKAGVPLITERCHGLEHLIPKDCYTSGRYNELTALYCKLKENSQRALSQARSATAFMNSRYDGLSLSAWKNILDKIFMKLERENREAVLLSR